MREMSSDQASRNFLEVIDAVEKGEVIVVTRNGLPVAEISPLPSDRKHDAAWQENYNELVNSLRNKRATGYRVGKITLAEKYDF